MKKALLSLLIITLFVQSCSMDDDFVPIYESGPMTYGWVNAKKNGVGFLASGVARRHSDKPEEYFGVGFDTYSEEGFHREGFHFDEIQYNSGSYIIAGRTIGGQTTYDGFVGGFYGTLADDGDVGEDFYIVDESANSNILTINTIDTINNIVKGSFNVRFVLDPNDEKTNPDNPDKITFSDAEFEVSFQ